GGTSKPIAVGNVAGGAKVLLWSILCLWFCFPVVTARASAQSLSDSVWSQPAAGVSGTTGLWKVFTADTLAAREVSFSASYDRVNRNPGYLTVSTASFAGAYGFSRRLEFGAALEANKRVL